MKTITYYYYRGDIERGTGGRRPGYRWVPGYSANSEDGKPLYPWSTRSECQREARQQGALAKFVRPTQTRGTP